MVVRVFQELLISWDLHTVFRNCCVKQCVEKNNLVSANNERSKKRKKPGELTRRLR